MKQNIRPIKPREAVAAFYETHGASFAETRQRPWGVMRLVTDALAPGMTLADIGAGNARLARLIPPDVRYIGVEPSSTLRKAAFRASSVQRELDIRDGALPRLPLRDGEADVAACIAVFHHLAPDERAPAVAEFARILKPGGRLVVTVWNLRGLRMAAWSSWLAAWLRFPLVKGGGRGYVWIPWRKDGARTARYVHAFTTTELRGLFDPAIWSVETCAPWGDAGSESLLRARHLVLVAVKK